MTYSDVSKHAEDLSEIEMMMLRDHIGRAYQLAEELTWCTPERHFVVHNRSTSEPTDHTPQEAVVPIISAEFKTNETARHALTQLKDKARELGLGVYDIHHSEDPVTLSVALEPFELN